MLNSMPRMYVDVVLNISPVGVSERKNWLINDRNLNIILQWGIVREMYPLP